MNATINDVKVQSCKRETREREKKTFQLEDVSKASTTHRRRWHNLVCFFFTLMKKKWRKKLENFRTSITINYFISTLPLSNQENGNIFYIFRPSYMCWWDIFGFLYIFFSFPTFFSTIFLCTFHSLSHIFTTENAQWKVKLNDFYATATWAFIELLIRTWCHKPCEVFCQG